jgi:LmbE family N-acetylglucosaminyl deacetylase
MHPSGTSAGVPGALPSAARVLAVTARPGQESVDLGGVLYAFRRAGASLSLLCLTRGEAAARRPGPAPAQAVRPWEVHLAAAVLGVSEVAVANNADGKLHQYPTPALAEQVSLAISRFSADLVLVVAPETGDLGEAAVASAATSAAAQAGVPVLARTRSGVSSAWDVDLGVDADVARVIQKSAAAAHTSQSDALPALLSRLDMLNRAETLRWLAAPGRVPAQRDLLATA